MLKISIISISTFALILYAIGFYQPSPIVFGHRSNFEELNDYEIITDHIDRTQCFTQTVVDFLQSPIAIKLNTFVIEPLILEQLMTSDDGQLLRGYNMLPNITDCENSFAIGLFANDIEVSNCGFVSLSSDEKTNLNVNCSHIGFRL